VRQGLIRTLSVILPLFALFEVNYPHLRPQSQLAIFALFGLALCFLKERESERALWLRRGDQALALLSALVCLYVVLQTEPAFRSLWLGERSLGDRAGAESGLDTAAGVIGLLLILEATRRSLGWVLPGLALAFVAYALAGASLPDWLLPHRGYPLDRIVAQTFLHSQGVFGIALRVMFTYVFLFVLFGALLEKTGATGFIVDAARRFFGRTTGGPAKVAVASSGLMGSLSGSAVANTATTGCFTIPMMRSAGFRPEVAAGVEAAASSGGALVPPVMGAGAYMMLEIINPPVTYLEIIRAALLPALLYYFSLFMIVHFTARRREAEPSTEAEPAKTGPLLRYEGFVFVAALGGLVLFLLLGFSVFRAVTLALGMVVLTSLLHRRSRPTVRGLAETLARASEGAVPLVAAAASVGIVIGVVTLTGIGTRLPALILPLAQEHLFLALLAIMISSIILGMGLPSAVCYLLMATLIGPVLGRLGVVPLAAHLFIFYFGMMSMVTPPVALAAYAASSIAGSRFLDASWAAFRFALVGFTLPFMFVFRPQLLMLGEGGVGSAVQDTVAAVILAVLGIVPLAAAIAGFLRGRLGASERVLLLLAAGLALFPGKSAAVGLWDLSWWNLGGVALFLGVGFLGSGRGRR
jgi:TRAP transporter 4TM/12TM fusion protein